MSEPTSPDTDATDDSTATRDTIWVEKYRPETLDDVVGQPDIIDRIQRNVADGDLPNLLFAGEAGIGKTTSACAIAKELYGAEWDEHFLELNASDERGIDVVRDRIKDFARSSFGNVDYRIIFLDEADSLTSSAQAALRRTMEQFSNNVRFILSCNYSSDIIDPIQSRCSVCRFTPINDDVVARRLNEIAENEDVALTESGADALVYAADGDMRRAINALQAAATLSDPVDEDAVYRITSTARPEEIEEMVETALAGNFDAARTQLDVFLREKGLSGGDILGQIHRLVWDFNVGDATAIEIMDRVGETDYRISEGADDRIQLEAFLASLAKYTN
ncbi:replication factor C small subunit [Salinibaculum rarum]|uniref:replication factor C small subunit n=1 Tax=Salinibaculum rarum TaxID=3058903 RepID=UPI00265F7022|nr:replication factor C small subunit [Salinibaculum sp. KK48]